MKELVTDDKKKKIYHEGEFSESRMLWICQSTTSSGVGFEPTSAFSLELIRRLRSKKSIFKVEVIMNSVFVILSASEESLFVEQ